MNSDPPGPAIPVVETASVAPDVRRVDFPVADEYATQADAFAAHVLDGAPPAITPEESMWTMRAIDAVFAAAR